MNVSSSPEASGRHSVPKAVGVAGDGLIGAASSRAGREGYWQVTFLREHRVQIGCPWSHLRFAFTQAWQDLRRGGGSSRSNLVRDGGIFRDVVELSSGSRLEEVHAVGKVWRPLS